MMNSFDDNDQIANLKNLIVNMYKYLLPVIYILGNLGTLLSALVFTRKSWKKNVCVFYFKICLLINFVHINSYLLGTMLTSSFHISPHDTNVVLCKVYTYTSYLFGALSPVILILASIDRLLISSHDVETRLYSSRRLAYFSISICTAITSIYHIHYLIKSNIQQLSPSYFGCYIDLSNSYRAFVSYSSAAINLLACLTMMILCIIAFKNVRRIRAVRRDGRTTRQIRSMTKKDFQLLRCLYAENVIYIIFSTMYTIYHVYLATRNNSNRTRLDEAVTDFIKNFLGLLLLIPYTSNFLVFMAISKAFRQEVKRMIYKIIGKEIVAIREEEHKPDNAEPDVVVVVVSAIKLST